MSHRDSEDIRSLVFGKNAPMTAFITVYTSTVLRQGAPQVPASKSASYLGEAVLSPNALHACHALRKPGFDTAAGRGGPPVAKTDGRAP